MKHLLALFLLGIFCRQHATFAQNLSPETGEIFENTFFENKNPAIENTAPGDLCPGDPCPCLGGYKEIKVYFFGTNNTQISVFANPGLTTTISSFPGVNSGQLLTISGAGQPDGILPVYSYIRTTDPGGKVCVTKIYTRCPTNAWPGALDDLKIVAKTFGDFIVFSVTDQVNSYTCDLSNAEQDWHVGGNVVTPAKNTLGTRNNEDVNLISDNNVRGVITKTGNFGLGNTAPGERLEVTGNTRLDGTLDVSGIARMNNTINSGSAANGALIVAGGAGVGKNLNVGENLDVTGTGKINSTNYSSSSTTGALVVSGGAGVGQNLHIGENLDVTGTGKINSTTNSTSSTTGALVVSGGTGVGQNLHVGENFDVSGTGKINSTINSSSAFTGALVVSGGAGVGKNLNVGGNAHVNGTMTIGTTNTPANIDIVNTSGYKLYVADGILSEEMLVSSNWADYVFKSDYPLRSLDEVKTFIQAEGHLPDTPAASEIEKGGIKLGECAVNQQVKIEELFLYIIQMNEEMKALKQENRDLKCAVEALQGK